MTVRELYRTYPPGACGGPSTPEGTRVRLRGHVDPDNVFDRETYPRLPYEKFTLQDSATGDSVEVWVAPADARGVFRRIRAEALDPRREVVVSGTIAVVDLPAMGACRRGLKIMLTALGASASAR